MKRKKKKDVFTPPVKLKVESRKAKGLARVHLLDLT